MLIALTLLLGAAPDGTWTKVMPGVEYARFVLEKSPKSGDGFAHVVRVDPKVAKLDFGLASENDGTLRTGAEWCADRKFAVVINAGMYDRDYVSNVGHLRRGAHFNNKRWNAKYQSVLTLEPTRLWDRDGSEPIPEKPRAVVQNLRLLKSKGQNVWQPNDDRWSEALIADDTAGRVLFVFVQSPFEMVALNDKLLALPLQLVRAMHVEGGPEATLSIHTKALNLDLAGGPRRVQFSPEDTRQWRIPNVLGVVAP